MIAARRRTPQALAVRRARYRRRKAAGKCQSCSQAAVPDKSYCEECLENHRLDAADARSTLSQ